jgi:alpha-tubulin suppressor-like RCC1 family protein
MEPCPRAIDMVHAFENQKVVQIAAGPAISGVLTENGGLYVWGRKLSHVPRRVGDDKSFGGKKITKIAIGGDSGLTQKSVVAAITEDSALWTFGDVGSHMLGNPMSNLAAVQGQQVEPVKVLTFANSKVVDVYCSHGLHMAAKVAV